MTISPVPDNEITDAVTATNAPTSSKAPAIALGSIYQAVANALGEAVQNAVNTQQQSYILAQAATTQGVMQLLSIDTASSTVSPNGDKTSAAAQALAATTAPEPVAGAIEQAIESGSKLGLDNAGPWSEAVRIMMSTVVFALRELQKVSQDNNMAMIKQAAVAAVLIAMIKAPDQLEQYEKILAMIQGL
jgi:Killing trait